MLILLASPLVFAVPTAWAQSNPSADDIIKSLTPTGNLTGALRGIKPAKPAADAAATTDIQPAAAHPAATRPAAARPAESEASVSLSVQFTSGSADLTPQAIATLDQLGRALASQNLSQYHFRIEGHTDTVGLPDYNKALSQRRAETVAAYLAQKFGIDSARLQPVGLGEEGLAVPTPPQTDNARNRRVKVVNLGA